MPVFCSKQPAVTHKKQQATSALLKRQKVITSELGKKRHRRNCNQVALAFVYLCTRYTKDS